MFGRFEQVGSCLRDFWKKAEKNDVWWFYSSFYVHVHFCHKGVQKTWVKE